MAVTQVLLEETSPNGNVQAIVEVADGACYFYLFGGRETSIGLRSVWVRNLAQAPISLDVDAMKGGKPPMNPRAHCAHPDGAAPLRQRELRVVWLPEGNGAGLYEQAELLAVIPPWSGEGTFAGYARDCVGEGPVAWPLAAHNALIERLDRADVYWRQWGDENPWPALQTALCEEVASALGKHSNYYAIDGGAWPPKALLRVPVAAATALVTIGVCIRPQPNVERFVEDPRPRRRIELGAWLPAAWPNDAITRFAGYLSAQSNLPWSRYTWLGPGHTIPCDAWPDARFEYALLTDRHARVHVNLGEHFEDPVTVLWLLPLTRDEQRRVVESGSDAVLRDLPPDRGGVVARG